MEYIRNNEGARPLVSIILLDWGVRESFHAVHYLNHQAFPRDRYEIIWVEFYDHKPEALARAQQRASDDRDFRLDKWIILGYPESVYYHKHLMYNIGFIAAAGEICAICDSDAIYPPTFIRSLHNAMKISKDLVVHVDQVRSENRKFYPFNYPRTDDILQAESLVNWTGSTTTGLANSADFVHDVNYGACMCARRRDIIGVGGADEHIEYLGYICGPYDLTWRLVNAGKHEQWLTHEFTYHTWHPGQAGHRNFGGPHDGRNVSSRALEARDTGRVMPFVEDPAILQLRQGTTKSADELLDELMRIDRSQWANPEQFLTVQAPVQLVKSNYRGHNIVFYKDEYYGMPHDWGEFSRPRAEGGDYDEVAGDSVEKVKRLIDERVGEAEPAEAGVYASASQHDHGAADCDEMPKEPTPPLAQAEVETQVLQPVAQLLSSEQAFADADGEIPDPAKIAPILVREGCRGLNIVRHDGEYYAVSQDGGAFDPDRLTAGRYGICYWGASEQEVVAKATREPATRVGQWALRPVRGGIARRIARKLLDPRGSRRLLRELGRQQAVDTMRQKRSVHLSQQLLRERQRLHAQLAANEAQRAHLAAEQQRLATERAALANRQGEFDAQLADLADKHARLEALSASATRTEAVDRLRKELAGQAMAVTRVRQEATAQKDQLRQALERIEDQDQALRRSHQEAKERNEVLRRALSTLREHEQAQRRSRLEMESQEQLQRQTADELAAQEQTLKAVREALSAQQQSLDEGRRQAEQHTEALRLAGQARQQQEQLLQAARADLDQQIQAVTETRGDVQAQRQLIDESRQQVQQHAEDLRVATEAQRQQEQLLQAARADLDQQTQAIAETRGQVQAQRQLIDETRQNQEYALRLTSQTQQEHGRLLEAVRQEIAQQRQALEQTRAEVERQRESVETFYRMVAEVAFHRVAADLKAPIGEGAAGIPLGHPELPEEPPPPAAPEPADAAPPPPPAKPPPPAPQVAPELACTAEQREAIDARLGPDAPCDQPRLPDAELYELVKTIDFSQGLPLENTFLYYCGRKAPAGGRIVDLGTGHGGSAYVFARAVQGRDVRIVSVDHRSDSQAVERLKNTPVELVEADSVAYAKKWRRRKDSRIDLLFIDSGHALADVFRDYRAWIGFVEPRGVVVFHDHDVASDGGTNHFGVRVFIDALRQRECLSDLYHSQRCCLGVKPPGELREVTLDDCKAALKRIAANICNILDGKATVIKAWPNTASRLVQVLSPRMPARICTPPDSAEPLVIVGSDQGLDAAVAAGQAPPIDARADKLTLLYVLDELIRTSDERTVMTISANRNAMLHWREGISMLAQATNAGGFPRQLDAIDATKNIEELSRYVALEQTRLLMLMELEQPATYL